MPPYRRVLLGTAGAGRKKACVPLMARRRRRARRRTGADRLLLELEASMIVVDGEWNKQK